MTFKRRKQTADQWEDEGAKKAPVPVELPSRQLHVRLTEDERLQLERAAAEHDTSMVRLARRAIRIGLAHLAQHQSGAKG